MKTVELRTKSVEELESLLLDHKKEAFNLRFQKSTGELESTNRIRLVRKIIAKIKTLLNEKTAEVNKN